jgi:hypothetical protein
MANNNLNVNRVLSSGGATLNTTNLAIETQKAGNPPIFQRAVVNEVIYNPKVLTNSDKERIKSSITNGSAVDLISANSIIATLISDGISNAIPTKVLLAPFFQSHFMLPVQAGEQVSVVFDDPQRFGFMGGKWITRISEGLAIEDVNFTHGDRRYNGLYLGSTGTSESLSRTQGDYSPDFQNGGRTTNTFSIPENENENGYDLIFERNQNSKLPHTYEVVPRWTKRPQELVLQGMNNSLIMLGQDRVGYVDGPPTGSAASNTEQFNYAGSVDIVAGRSRYILKPEDKTIPASMVSHKATSPFVVVNSRGLPEVDKYPELNGRREQPKEGDTDFIHDAARIYVSMKTLGDTNFRTANTVAGNPADAMQPTGINYSPNGLFPVQFNSSSQEVGTSYIVNKADHLRFIARRSIPQEDTIPNPDIINGSVLIVKEGKFRTPEDINAQAHDGDHLAFMYMSPEGRVQIDGLQIFLGGAAINTDPAPSDKTKPAPDRPRNTEGSNSEIAVGDQNAFAGAEPYIKWSEFKKVVEGLQQQINDLQTAYHSLVMNSAAAIGQSHCAPGGPDTAWAFLSQQLNQANSSLESSIRTHRTATNQAVYKSRSSKIFGQ